MCTLSHTLTRSHTHISLPVFLCVPDKGPGLPLYTLRDSRDAGSGKLTKFYQTLANKCQLKLKQPIIWKSVGMFYSFPEIRVLEDNTILDSILRNIAMPSVMHGTLPISGFGEVTPEDPFDYSVSVHFWPWNQTVLLPRPTLPDDSASWLPQVQKVSSADRRVRSFTESFYASLRLEAFYCSHTHTLFLYTKWRNKNLISTRGQDRAEPAFYNRFPSPPEIWLAFQEKKKKVK